MKRPHRSLPARRLVALSAVSAALLASSACQRQDEQADEAEPGVATFAVEAPIPAEGEGRLPADGDLAAYVPATELFPGVARIDPNIANPLAGDPQAVAAGERHFAAFNCAGCHAPLGGGGMGPPLSDDAWIYGSEPAQVYISIMQGRPAGMPAWSSMLPRRTVWELVAYIETLDDIDDYAAELGFGGGAGAGAARTGDASEQTPAP